MDLYRNGWRNHLPLIRTMTLLVGLLAFIGWGLSSLQHGWQKQGLDRSSWQYAPAVSFGDAVPPGEGWIPYASGIHNNTNVYWLSIPLPAAAPRAPYLWIFNAVSFKVTDGNRLLYTYDPAQNGQRINLFTHWNLAQLPSPLPSQIYLLLDNRGASRPAPSIQVVSKGDLYVQLFRKDGYSFVLGALFLFTAFTAIGLYFVRRDKLQLYFSLLSFCSFYASLVRNDLLQVYWDQPWLAYLDFAVFPIGVYALVSIMREVFPSPRVQTLHRLRQAIILASGIIFVSAVWLDTSVYGWLLSYPLLLLFFVTAVVLFTELRAHYRERQGPDSVWMLSGFAVVAFFGLLHVIRTYLPAGYDQITVHVPALTRLPFDPLSVGLLLFLICLIRVILYRFGLMNKQLQHIGEYLEKSVRERTSELEERTIQLQESSARLAATTRETAETIASSMVLEERNRITGNIHDTVGHALTATIMQLEAARRLLDRDPRLAMDKVAASQELIRKGLEDIRQSARLLRDDFSRYDLADAMAALIRDTERTTESQFKVRIDPLPESLTTLQKRVLYQALQEGITNGLRHGGSTRFIFSLTVSSPIILFRLESDGLTYTPSAFGFGLKAMSERIVQLGGVMSVEPGHPGCVLLLTLPFEHLSQQEALL